MLFYTMSPHHVAHVTRGLYLLFCQSAATTLYPTDIFTGFSSLWPSHRSIPGDPATTHFSAFSLSLPSVLSSKSEGQSQNLPMFPHRQHRQIHQKLLLCGKDQFSPGRCHPVWVVCAEAPHLPHPTEKVFSP